MVARTQDKTKVIVRRLPPGLTEEGFKAALEKAHIDPSTYNWFSYHQGKVSLKQVVLSRAYLNFTEPRHVFSFKQAFDGHVFVTTKGTQYRCAVEYALYQKVPQTAKQRNPLEGTIEQDSDYQAFLKTLEEGPSLLPSAAIQREQQEKAAAAAGTAAGVVITPLMQYLKEKHAAGSQKHKAARGKPPTIPPITEADQGVKKAMNAASTAIGGDKTSAKGKKPQQPQQRSTGTAQSKTQKGDAGPAITTAPKVLTGKSSSSSGGGGAGGAGQSIPPQKTTGGGGQSNASQKTTGGGKDKRPISAVSDKQQPSRPSSASAKPSVQPTQPAGKAVVKTTERTQETKAAAQPPVQKPQQPLPAQPAAQPPPSDNGQPVAEQQAAAPARRVRAGFQAYRPPTRKE